MSTGCTADSAPLRFPRAVRTASTMTASPTTASFSSDALDSLWICWRGCGPLETPAKAMPKPSTGPPAPFHVGLGLMGSHVPEWILSNDGLRALGAHRDGDRLDADQLLDPLDVAPRVVGQFRIFAQVGERLFPSG